jgi:hypothetical protein
MAQRLNRIERIGEAVPAGGLRHELCDARSTLWTHSAGIEAAKFCSRQGGSGPCGFTEPDGTFETQWLTAGKNLLALADLPRATPGAMAPKSLPYADVCENNELRTYCISIKPLSISGR